MKIAVYIAPFERADALEAYENYLTPEMRQQILGADDDVWFELHIDDGKATLEVDQNVEDEKRAPKKP